jgi:cation diffusion facilitator CzcD-associated flavoprotein CzcO
VEEAHWDDGKRTKSIDVRSIFRYSRLDHAPNTETPVSDGLLRCPRLVLPTIMTSQAQRQQQVEAEGSDIDHPYAAKRPPIDTDYFETYNRPNVTLVDLKAGPIERITPLGVCTTQAEHPLDIIVFATGFDAMTGPMLRMDIRGRSGVALKDVWKAGPRNYLGLQVAGFPNLFTITGPGSPSVLCNMPVAIEQHADWIADCIKHMRGKGLERIEARPDAMDKWVAEVNDAASKTVLPMAKHSWYLGANIPGKPRVFMPYAGGMVRYREICAEVAEHGYEGFALS